METGMHWSYRAALRFLTALERRGWTASTWQLQEDLRSVAVHSDAASARCLFRALLCEASYAGRSRECGAERWEASVSCKHVGTTEDGRHVYSYDVPRRFRPLAGRLLAYSHAHPVPRGERPDFAAMLRVLVPVQGTLFTAGRV